MVVNLLKDMHDVYTQRNNLLYPDETCWPTSAIQAMHITGKPFPEGRHEQPEDNLADFCMKDRRIKKMWDSYDSEHNYLPWQIHDVLSNALNMWTGEATAFREILAPMPERTKHHIMLGRCVVMSGKFPYYSGRPISHAICIHGFDDNGVFICDPWGDYEELYASGVKCVRNKHMPWKDFNAYMGGSAVII